MSMPAPRRLSYSITNASELRSPSQTSPLNVRRIGGVTMAENCPSTRLSIAQEPHRNRVNEGSALRFSCHAHYTHVSQSLWRGLSNRYQKREGFGGAIMTTPGGRAHASTVSRGRSHARRTGFYHRVGALPLRSSGPSLCSVPLGRDTTREAGMASGIGTGVVLFCSH